MEPNDFENSLKVSSDKLNTAHFIEANVSGHWSVELDSTEKTNSKWLAYMSEALKRQRRSRSIVGVKKETVSN